MAADLASQSVSPLLLTYLAGSYSTEKIVHNTIKKGTRSTALKEKGVSEGSLEL
jgi:hypothetical protein